MTNDTSPKPITRRRMLAGTVGAGLATAAVFQIGRAQEESATPTASPTTGGTTGAQSEETLGSNERATLAIERASAAITAAQTDRDAVVAQINATTIDALIAQATDLRDRAQQSTGGDTAGTLRLAFAAVATARAAGDLVGAQLTYPGLPSQEAPASRVLARAHEMIQTVSAETAATADSDVTFAVTTAQVLYTAAHDLYSGAAVAQGARTARVGAHLARVGWFLSGVETGEGLGGRRDGGLPGMLDGRDGPGVGHGRRGGRHHEPEDLLEGENPDRDEPVTVPAPDF